jgi:hypothetical protein
LSEVPQLGTVLSIPTLHDKTVQDKIHDNADLKEKLTLKKKLRTTIQGAVAISVKYTYISIYLYRYISTSYTMKQNNTKNHTIMPFLSYKYSTCI